MAEGIANAADAALKRTFNDFLEYDFSNRSYGEELRRLVERGEARLVLSIDDMRSFDPDFCTRVLSAPAETVPTLEAALHENLVLLDPTFFEMHPDVEAKIGLSGKVTSAHVTPRGLSARFLGRVVCVDGIVTKCSLVRPKLLRSVHYCPATNEFKAQVYRDATALRGLPTSMAYPTRDEAGNTLVTEYGLSTYRDTQTLSIQEMPEAAPAGQLPRSVDCILDGDMVDRVKPGDRVRLYGIYRALAPRDGGAVSGVFRTVLLVNNIAFLGKQAAAPTMTEQDLERIRRLADPTRTSGPKLVSELAKSVAPSIFGHEAIKKAILLVLVGGVEKNLPNGAHLRGDINVLLVGDPSTAKSQLLRFVLKVAPLAISTTGKGSSGVGLTAAVVQDSETGERTLQAGAMVLADRGIVCIDEFDKMNDADRVAMHEVMEQQTVTIAKAGVHTSLNARCSVVAAANPVYGNYDASRRPMENIGLPDSLLSRFDLLFVVLDALSAEQDRAVAEHVLRMHRFRVPGDEGDPLMLGADRADGAVDDSAGATLNEDGESIAPGGGHAANDDDDDDDFENRDEAVGGDDNREIAGGSGMYQRYHPLLHRERGLLTLSFLKKYIYYAKSRITPVLSDEARDAIVSSYADLRAAAHGDRNTLPITPRALETLIRLATAHARLRLSQQITKEDAEQAISILKHALYHENIGDNVKLAKGHGGADDSSDDEETLPLSSTSRQQRAQSRSEKRGSSGPKKRSAAEDDLDGDHVADPDDPFAFDDEDENLTKRTSPKKKSKKDEPSSASKVRAQSSESGQSSHQPSASREERVKRFRYTLSDMLHRSENGSMPIQQIRDKFQGQFSAQDIASMLQEMEKENKVYVHPDSNEVYLV